MADTGQLVGAASGAMTGAKIGTAIMPGVGTVVGGILGGVAGLFGSKSSKSSLPTYKPINISEVITTAREQAKTNYAQSIALEQQYRPGTAALRTATDLSLTQSLQGNTPTQRYQLGLLDSLGGNYGSNPLLEESANRILQNLRLGGALGADVQAQAVQAALQKGGAAGISGSGAARGLVARDLGLTSLALEQQRIDQAQKAGQAQATLNLQNLQTRGGLINTATAMDLQNRLGIAGLVDARPFPTSGLSAGDVGSLMVADNIAMNRAGVDAAKVGQNARNQSLNALLGFGSQIAGGGFDKTLGAIGGLFGGKASGGIGGEEDELASLLAATPGR